MLINIVLSHLKYFSLLDLFFISCHLQIRYILQGFDRRCMLYCFRLFNVGLHYNES